MLDFREEVGGHGLSSYPHPWLMPDFWQFPTVSMGLGPLLAIYQARFLKYLHSRGLADTAARQVWAFLGDGEMDEPESTGALSLAGRERLDNLIFVVNCNLQRLDGPVRGNGKIVQELEAVFRGAGWNVIKVIWGSGWDPLIASDTTGLLLKRMEEAVDGEYQDFKSKNGAYVREHFFGRYPELLQLVSHMSDDEIWALSRGGHDPRKVYAAYAAAVAHTGQPTVIPAKTVKGYGMGEAGEGQNITHQQKKMGLEALRAFRDRFDLPVEDDRLDAVPFLRPPDDSPEVSYLRENRARLGGSMPARRRRSEPLPVPGVSAFDAQLKGTVSGSSNSRANSGRYRPGRGRGSSPPPDLAGGTFTISSLGGIGGTSFTPIVNAPEVAILGVVRSRMMPVWNGTEFIPRLVLPLSLSYDHRVIDGALAARFARQLCQLLEDDRRLLL